MVLSIRLQRDYFGVGKAIEESDRRHSGVGAEVKNALHIRNIVNGKIFLLDENLAEDSGVTAGASPQGYRVADALGLETQGPSGGLSQENAQPVQIVSARRGKTDVPDSVCQNPNPVNDGHE